MAYRKRTVSDVSDGLYITFRVFGQSKLSWGAERVLAAYGDRVRWFLSSDQKEFALCGCDDAPSYTRDRGWVTVPSGTLSRFSGATKVPLTEHSEGMLTGRFPL